MNAKKQEMTLCERVCGNMDVLASDYKGGESYIELREHLRVCPQCSTEARNRKQMQERLKSAFSKVEAPPYLEARIRSNIRAAATAEAEQQEAGSGGWFRWRFVAMAAASACLGMVIVYQLGSLRMKTGFQEAYITSISTRVATLMRAGLGDHLHCTVFRKFPKQAPSAEELTQKMGPEYAGLIPIVRKHVPPQYKMVIAHECRHRGRKFLHLSLKGEDAGLLSLVIARKSEGESFETEGLIPGLVQSGIPMYQSEVLSYSIASFESAAHLVYFISDLPKETNSRMMVAMSVELKSFLETVKL